MFSKLFISFFICISSTWGREKLEINIGQKVQILSDKAFRRLKEDKFEAVGNVIITYAKLAIYGEEASLSFRDNVVNVVGSVRYIDSIVTIYASELTYNFKTEELFVNNGRVVSDNYVILGKTIVKKLNGELTAEDAEYTTCKDCPESWSIFGNEVKVTRNEYLRVKHAYIKAKGTVIFYIPYLILPIKKERESGLLFPYLSMSKHKGTLFQLPYFWAINQNSDMTLTPSMFGKRGRGSEFQYRYLYDEKKWFEVDMLYASDPLYIQEGRGRSDKNRYIGSYEHHFSTPEMWNHHFFLERLHDLDTVRDFDFYTKDRIKSPDVGGSAFLGFRRDLFQLSLSGHRRRNQVFHNSREFDHKYVQIFPRLTLSTSPISLYQKDSSFLSNILIGLESDYAVFRQNYPDDSSYIRNASRVNSRPYVRTQWANWGPLNLSTLSFYEHQYYSFDKLKRNRFFLKSGISYQTDMALSLSKTYGKAYVKEIPLKDLEIQEQEEDKMLIEGIPVFETRFSKNEIFESINSYMHNQDIVLKHHFLSDQKSRGNLDFYKQIDLMNGNGQFDYIDAPRSKQHLIRQRENLITLPQSNTIELQWNHSLIRKQVRNPSQFSIKSQNHFNYMKVAYFGISQGYDLSLKNKEAEAEVKVKDKLTRLHLNAEFLQDNYSFNAQEYYFHALRKHIFQMNSNFKYDWGRLFTRYNYDTLSTLERQFINVGTEIKLFNKFTFFFHRGFDLNDEDNIRKGHGVQYSPTNNCWKIDLRYDESPFERRISVQFLVNFNKNQFRGFGRSFTRYNDAS